MQVRIMRLFYYFLPVLKQRRETAETVSDFILGGSKITADSDCSHEIKRRLPLGKKKKSYDQPRMHVRIKDFKI